MEWRTADYILFVQRSIHWPFRFPLDNWFCAVMFIGQQEISCCLSFNFSITRELS